MCRLRPALDRGDGTERCCTKSYARCHNEPVRDEPVQEEEVRDEEVTVLTLRIADGPQPLHERVAAAVRRAIVEGAVGPGDALPAAVQVADALGVHRNTVLRAYRTLRDEGTIDLRAGRGAHVRRELPAAVPLLDLVDELLEAAGRESVSGDEVAALVRSRAAERRADHRTPRSD